MKIALSTQVCRDWDLEDSLRAAAEIGYDGIELLIWEPHTTLEKLQPILAEMKTLAETLGIEIPVVTLTESIIELAAQPEYWQGIVEIGVDLGAQVVKTPTAPPPSGSATDHDFQQAARAARQCGDAAAAQGLKLACETHLGMVSDTVAGTVRFLEEVGPGAVYLTLDICNVYTCGDDPLAAVEALGARTTLLHVKDGQRLDGGDWTWHPLGKGAIDFPAVLAVLDQQGYGGWASIECLIYTDKYIHLDETNTRRPEIIARHDLRAFRQVMDSEAQI